MGAMGQSPPHRRRLLINGVRLREVMEVGHKVDDNDVKRPPLVTIARYLGKKLIFWPVFRILGHQSNNTREIERKQIGLHALLIGVGAYPQLDGFKFSAGMTELSSLGRGIGNLAMQMPSQRFEARL